MAMSRLYRRSSGGGLSLLFVSLRHELATLILIPCHIVVPIGSPFFRGIGLSALRENIRPSACPATISGQRFTIPNLDEVCNAKWFVKPL